MRDLVSESARQGIGVPKATKAVAGRYSEKESGASRHQHPPEEWDDVRQIRVRNGQIAKVRNMVQMIEGYIVTDREAIDIALTTYREQNAKLAAERARSAAEEWADG